jgi:hypothetical protein
VLTLAHAFLIVAAVEAAPSRAAPTVISEEDGRAADHYVKDGTSWTRELTSLGEGVGNMLADVLDGKQTGKVMRAEIKRVAGVIDDRLASFKARPSPGFPEMVAFRTLFIDYIAWEGRAFVRVMNDMLKIAEDKKRARDAKAEALLKAMRASDAEERVWKAKLEPAQAAVYAAINRK